MFKRKSGRLIETADWGEKGEIVQDSFDKIQEQDLENWQWFVTGERDSN
jgi:hypothetical protein